MHKNLLTRLLTILLSLIVWGLVGEGISLLWIHSFGKALEISRPLLEADAELGWKQRPHLSTEFLKTIVATNEWGWRTHPLAELNSESRKILVLGPSSSFGWGVEQGETYSAQLERLLGGFSQVINAGEIGYSSFQGVRLFRQTIERGLRPSIVVIAYGINDLDRFRFYFQSPEPDSRALLAPFSPVAVSLQNLTSSNALMLGLSAFSGAIQRFNNPAVGLNLANHPVPALRVSPTEFHENLRTLVKLSRENQAEPILLTSVYQSGGEVIGIPPAVADLNAHGMKSWEQGDHKQARIDFEESVRQLASQNEPYYYLASLDLESRQSDELKKHLTLALAHEPARIQRDAMVFNAEVFSLAREEGVRTGDLSAWLSGESSSNLFVDPVHPSAKGHFLIAQGLKEIVERVTKDGSEKIGSAYHR